MTTRPAPFRETRATALCSAILAHAALLAPLALGALGLEFERVEDGAAPVLLIQLEPPSTAAPPPPASRPGRATTINRPSRDHLPLRATPTLHPAAVAPEAPVPAEASTAIDSRWRVRPAIGGSGWSDCPEAFTTPPAQKLCNERDRMRLAAAASRRAQAPVPGPALPFDAAPNGAFARAAAANQAWRDYTRNDGPYPGLISLLRDH